MNNGIERLISLLRCMSGLYAELCVAARKMNDGLRARKIDAVRQETANYDRQICEIEKFEEQRLALCDKIKTELDFPDRHLSLTAIIGAAPAAQRSELESARAELKRRMEELAGINTSNQVLLGEAMNDIDVTMRIILKTGNKFTGYGSQGTKDQTRPGRQLINRVA